MEDTYLSHRYVQFSSCVQTCRRFMSSNTFGISMLSKNFHPRQGSFINCVTRDPALFWPTFTLVTLFFGAASRSVLPFLGPRHAWVFLEFTPLPSTSPYACHALIRECFVHQALIAYPKLLHESLHSQVVEACWISARAGGLTSKWWCVFENFHLWRDKNEFRLSVERIKCNPTVQLWGL